MSYVDHGSARPVVHCTPCIAKLLGLSPLPRRRRLGLGDLMGKGPIHSRPRGEWGEEVEGVDRLGESYVAWYVYFEAFGPFVMF